MAAFAVIDVHGAGSVKSLSRKKRVWVGAAGERSGGPVTRRYIIVRLLSSQERRGAPGGRPAASRPAGHGATRGARGGRDERDLPRLPPLWRSLEAPHKRIYGADGSLVRGRFGHCALRERPARRPAQAAGGKEMRLSRWDSDFSHMNIFSVVVSSD